MTTLTDLEYCQTQLSQYWDAYLQQINWLEQDISWILQQLHADNHRMLTQIQKERAFLYAGKPDAEKAWKRLRQLDQWVETVLQQFHENQLRCLSQMQQQRSTLYCELKLNCDGLLLSTLIGSDPAEQPPAT